MGSNIQNGRDSIKSDFIRVIKNFSGYLAGQKETGHGLVRISEQSKALMNNWAKPSLSPPLFFFEGPETASIFILDSENNFFRGKSGQMFKNILGAMNLSPDRVFICNAGAKDAVHQKIKLISPKVIITLGTNAAQSLLGMKCPLEQFRGRFCDYHGIKVMPTLHPSLLVTQPEYKRQVWEDMKQVIAYAGLKHDS